MAQFPGVAPGTPRELLADAVDQLAEMSKTMVVKAVDSVVEPIADQGVKLAGEGMKLAGEGVKLAAAAGRLAEDRLRKVLRHRRPDDHPDKPEKPDDKKKG